MMKNKQALTVLHTLRNPELSSQQRPVFCVSSSPLQCGLPAYHILAEAFLPPELSVLDLKNIKRYTIMVMSLLA